MKRRIQASVNRIVTGSRIGAVALWAIAWSAFPSEGQCQQLPQPTNEHKEMAREAGDWDAQMKVWMAPNGESFSSKGSESVRLLGSFWLVAEFEGEVMGMKFSGRSQMGYDPQKKKYIGTWIDSMSPYAQHMEGDYDVAAHVLTMMHKGYDWEKGKEIVTKSVTRYVDKNAKIFEMYGRLEDVPAGAKGAKNSDVQDGDGWWKMLEINYVRKAQP